MSLAQKEATVEHKVYHRLPGNVTRVIFVLQDNFPRDQRSLNVPPVIIVPMVVSVERPCESGSYQDEYGQWECKECPAGFYCDATIVNVTSCMHGVQLPTPCPRGYYCPNGTAEYFSYGCPNGSYLSLSSYLS